MAPVLSILGLSGKGQNNLPKQQHIPSSPGTPSTYLDLRRSQTPICLKLQHLITRGTTRVYVCGEYIMIIFITNGAHNANLKD